MDDIISYLKFNNVDFSSMTPDDLLWIKENRSTPDLDLQQKDGETVQKFSRIWYDDYPWLTGSASFNRMFCFVCALFGGETAWGSMGTDSLKNFPSRATKHQNTKKHIKNMETFLMIGKIRRLRDNEKLLRVAVEKQQRHETERKESITKIIEILIFAIKNNVNHGGVVEESLKIMQRRINLDGCDFNVRLLTSMEHVLIEEIKKELRETEFCSIQFDEVPNSCMEFSLIVRYVHGGLVKERFAGFFKITTIIDISQIINTVIGDGRKIVCHSYDGSISMKFYRAAIKALFPNCLFIHNHAHKLNTILLQGLQNIKVCQVYASQVTFICEFFQDSRRATRLRRENVALPTLSETIWKFHSKAVCAIIKNHSKILSIINNILDIQSVDMETMNAACCIKNTLNNILFVLLCCLFNKIFVYVDHLSNILHRRLDIHVEACILEIWQTVKNLSNFKTDVVIKHCVDETEMHLDIDNISDEIIFRFKELAFLIIDDVIQQIEERTSDIKYLKFVKFLDNNKFIKYKSRFPKTLFQEFAQAAPCTFDFPRLENELATIYDDITKKFSPYQLFSYLYDNDLASHYKETFKLLKLYLTYPLSAVDQEKYNTLTRLRNFLVLSKDKQRSYAALYVQEFQSNDNYTLFKEKVITHFDETEKNYF